MLSVFYAAFLHKKCFFCFPGGVFGVGAEDPGGESRRLPMSPNLKKIIFTFLYIFLMKMWDQRHSPEVGSRWCIQPSQGKGRRPLSTINFLGGRARKVPYVNTTHTLAPATHRSPLEIASDLSFYGRHTIYRCDDLV